MSMSMSTSTSTPAAGREVHALSCVNCRQRKVKCAKVYPCPHCVRGGFECIFPTRKKDRAPRRNKNHELLSRLAKLEAIVGQVDPASAGSSPSAAPPRTAAAAAAAAAPRPELEPSGPQKRCRAAGPVSRDDPAAKYVSGEFWANLSTEVEGIKAALEMPSDTDDEDDGGDGPADAGGQSSVSPEAGGAQDSYGSPASYLVSSAMFGNAQTANAVARLRHPPPERIKKLRDIYFRNVDPLLKILHRPTIEKKLDIFIVNPHDQPPSPPAEALWFAMYFAAVTSTSPESCLEQLGEDRGLLVAEYRQGVEMALARADYLNSTSLESLQALTLYDTCLRSHTQSRASWAILALVYRLAQATGLQRDGNGSAYSPYEAEMRRRLWSQIIVLDVRASQDRGTEPMIQEESFNTIPPTNISDDNFNPDITTPIPQLAREGPTDVTFSLCTYHCSSLYLHIHGPRSRFFKPRADDPSTAAAAGGAPQLAAQASEEDVIQRIKALEAQFVTPALAHPTHFPSAMAAAVVRVTTLIIWLTIQYPFRVRQPTVKPRVSREHMLQTAVAILDLAAFGPSVINRAEWRARFGWWQDGYVQWHALAVALAELCVQTDGALVDRAWATAEKALAMWGGKVADSKRGALWRPIRKLLRRARARRAEARLRKLRIHQDDDMAPRAREPPPVQQQQQQQQRDTETSWLPIPSSPKQVLARVRAREAVQGEPVYVEAQPQETAAMDTGGRAGGVPLAPDFGGGISTSSVAENAFGLPPAVPPGSGPGTETIMTLPPALIIENAHNQWTIDFGDVGAGLAALDPALQQQQPDQQQELDTTMDWSVWNEFVVDAIAVEDGTSPSSEGKAV